MQKMAAVMTASSAATQAVLEAATQTSEEGMKDAGMITDLAVSRILTADLMLFVGLAAASQDRLGGCGAGGHHGGHFLHAGQDVAARGEILP